MFISAIGSLKAAKWPIKHPINLVKFSPMGSGMITQAPRRPAIRQTLTNDYLGGPLISHSNADQGLIDSIAISPPMPGKQAAACLGRSVLLAGIGARIAVGRISGCCRVGDKTGTGDDHEFHVPAAKDGNNRCNNDCQRPTGNRKGCI